MGCVLPANLGHAPARQAARKAGLADSVCEATVNKVCGSGLKTVMLAADSITDGLSEVCVAGGMESMTNAPFLLTHMRVGKKIGNDEVLDHLVRE